MPWYIIAYLIIFLLFAIAGIIDDYSNKTPFSLLAIAVMSEAIIGFLFIAYWHPMLLAGNQIIIIALYLLAVIWQAYSIYSDVKIYYFNQDGDEVATSLKVITIAAAVVLFTTIPAIIVAGIVAFQ